MLFKHPPAEHFNIDAVVENLTMLFSSIDISFFRLGQSDMRDRIADDTCLRRDNSGVSAAACLQLGNNIADVFFCGVQGDTQGFGDYLV